MKCELQPSTSQPDSFVRDRPQFPDDKKTQSAPRLPGLELAASNYAETARLLAAVEGEDSDGSLTLRGEFGRIRMLQGRLDEAEQLLATVYRASDLQSPDCARPIVYYAAVLHRLQRDAEATAVLDRIELLLANHPERLGVETSAAAILRAAMVAD
jgi:hypothetical protein